MSFENWLEHLQALETVLEVTFKNKALLLRAITHRSYLNENRGERALGQNERLEFLGDAVLEVIVAEYLYRNLPQESDEGVLTNIRGELVSTRSLGKVAEELGLNKYLRLSNGERKETSADPRRCRHLYANVLEAIIGAIYLDRGMPTTEIFVQFTVIPRLEILMREGSRDWKSQYQELIQAREGITPHYQLLRREGSDHEPRHIVALYVGKRWVIEARGVSRINAEMHAAYQALKQLGKNLPEFDEDWV